MADTKKLLAYLNNKYSTSLDIDGNIFCGANLQWDYNDHTVTLDILHYTPRTITRFSHTQEKPPPHPYIQITYTNCPLTPYRPITPSDKMCIQQFSGVLLYYACTINLPQLPYVNLLAFSITTDGFPIQNSASTTSSTTRPPIPTQNIYKLVRYTYVHILTPHTCPSQKVDLALEGICTSSTSLPSHHNLYHHLMQTYT